MNPYFLYKAPKLVSAFELDSKPNRLLLDTTELTDEMWSKVQALPMLSWEKDDVVEFLLGCLMYEKEAQLELGYSCLELVSRTLGREFEQHSRVVAHAVVEMGTQVLQQLQLLRAYHRGYLFYQFSGWVGRDILLEKFQVDFEPDPHYLAAKRQR